MKWCYEKGKGNRTSLLVTEQFIFSEASKASNIVIALSEDLPGKV